VKVGFFQFAPIFGSPDKNRQTLVEGVSQSGVDLLVAPELATSGYFFPSTAEAERLAEPIPGPTTEALEKAAAESGTTVVTGIAERGGNILYNSAVIVGPEGLIGTYRKVHLFNEEKLHFSPGTDDFFIFELQGVRVGVLVCFDHMFPEAARSLALRGAQIICHPSNLVLPEYAQLTSRVRALENRVFWILANRWGEESVADRTLTYTGTSQVVHPRGTILSRADARSDMISTVEIDPDDAKNKLVTPLNDLFEDRRPELYTG
jgi:predicted amidohydrolase